MNNSKGFTMVEMMLAAAILAIALAGAMSFFIYQSKSGADSGKLKAARENLSLALTLLQRDIMLAGYGVYTVTTVNPKTLSLVILPNHGVDDVNGDVLNGVVVPQWDRSLLPRLAANVADDPFLPTTANFSPDKLYVGYGNFLDMSFDVDDRTDANSAFKYSVLRTTPTVQPPPMPRSTNQTTQALAAATKTFVYDLFQYAPGLTVTKDTKPLGGFICDAGANRGADVDWVATGDPAKAAPPWNFHVTAPLLGNVSPAIVYRIAWGTNPDGTKRPTYELQRNGIRIAGGDPGMEVYNLTVIDQSGVTLGIPNQRMLSIRIDYQVMLSGSPAEATLHGTDKTTWHKGWVTIESDPRIIVLNDGS